MFLKSLEIYGFKSFADRTRINFADGITALLGPNGCGKSNVVDAIKWVLAENKSKNLRAESMEDVIFNGTETRPSLSVAEVTLTIANDNGLLPIADSEIAIKRRLYRSGENEYFINDRQAKASEIKKLFMDTGVGKAAYSVMEQGKIDQILSSKPEDRRYLFEEAAGISRSKAEVQEAERELERTRANLSQIDLGLAETKRNYETLKVQADKTSKYRKLQDQLFNLELDIQLLKLKDFTQEKARRQESKKDAEEKRAGILKELDNVYAELSENTEKIRKLNDELNSKQIALTDTHTKQQGKKDLVDTHKRRQIEIKGSIGQIENKIKNINEKIESYNEEIDEENSELYKLNKTFEDLKKNIQTFIENIQNATLKIDENQKVISCNSGKINNLAQERKGLQEELEAITENIVTELDAKLKDAGYSSASNRKAKEELLTQVEKLKIYSKGRANIFSDFSSLPSHTSKDANDFANDAVAAFNEILSMLENVKKAVEEYSKTTPQFIDDFLSPEGIITKKRNIDLQIQKNLSQVEEYQKQNEELSKSNKELEANNAKFKETLSDLHMSEAKLSQQIQYSQQQISSTKKLLADEKERLREEEEEHERVLSQAENLKEIIEDLEEEIAELQQKGLAILDEIDKLNKEIADCNSSDQGKKSFIEKKTAERDKYQAIIERTSIQLGQSETEIANVKNNFQDKYSRDLLEFEERMYTIKEPAAKIKEKLFEVKEKVQSLGNVNPMALEDFAEAKERYERLQTSYNDTQKSLENLTRVSEEIRTKSSEMFLETYNKIRRNFHNMFRRMMNGGKAELRLVDPTNVLTSGIDIFAQPPGKKLVNISLLSGGEKTMTAVALLFATYQVRPSPFCLLDEIDAALDDKNVSSFVNTLRAFEKVSQYIIITHNKKTVTGASTMLGVSMMESGITKVIQIKLDDETLNGSITFDDQSDFVEEDVPEEEGVVIPPRPPRREHNPDGSLKIKGNGDEVASDGEKATSAEDEVASGEEKATSAEDEVASVEEKTASAEDEVASDEEKAASAEDEAASDETESTPETEGAQKED